MVLIALLAPGGALAATLLVFGDSLSADIAGALRFGYTACWYNPDGHAMPDDERPHHTVSHLMNVMDILR